MKKLLLLLLFSLPAFGQVPTSQNLIFVSTSPSGSCTNATAAAITVLGYISSVSANTVVFSHAATVALGGTINIVCTVN